MGKNLPAMQETQVRSLGREDSLENSMDRGAWCVTVHGSCKESDMTERLIFFSMHCDHYILFKKD